jgi:hypothetical protein
MRRGSIIGTWTTPKPGLELPFAHEHDAEVQALVAQVRERVPRVDRDRRQDREDLAVKALVERRERRGELLRLDDDDPLLGELGQQLRLEVLAHLLDELVDARR